MDLNARPLIDPPGAVKEPTIELLFEGHPASHWRQLAAEQRKLSREAFDHSDSVIGVASNDLANAGQDALHLSRRHDLCAELAETGGIRMFQALFDASGVLVSQATHVHTVHGEWVWRIGEGSEARWFRPSRAKTPVARRATDLRRGYLIGEVRMRAVIRTGMRQRGTGIHVWHYFTRDPDSPIEILNTGTAEGYERRNAR